MEVSLWASSIVLPVIDLELKGLFIAIRYVSLGIAKVRGVSFTAVSRKNQFVIGNSSAKGLLLICCVLFNRVDGLLAIIITDKDGVPLVKGLKIFIIYFGHTKQVTLLLI